jgi:protein DGCR14
MASEKQQALTKRSTDTQLMPPPSKRIKRPPKVLDEDVYAGAVAEIIARDFFPGLEETRTQLEYLDALESRDNEWISMAGQRLTEVMTPTPGCHRKAPRDTPGPSQTPTTYGGDTPMSIMSDVFTASSNPRSDVDINMRLDSFVSKYTSEDNESFYKVLDKQNEKRAEKYAWLRADGNKIPAARQLIHRRKEEKLLKAKEEQQAENEGQELQVISELDKRKAMPDTWKSKPDNELMFAPDGVEDYMETIQERAEAESKAAPKGVVHGNTRLPPPKLVSDPTIPPSPSLSAVREAIAGRPRPTASEAGYTGGETPRVNGYAFVDEDEPEAGPAPHPSMSRVDPSPSPFKIKDQSRREALHYRMVDKAARSKRTSARNGMTGKLSSSPVPKFPNSPSIRSNLTPAGERLWSRVGTPRTSNLGGVFGNRETTGRAKESGLRFRWTPTPRAEAVEK